MTYLQLINDVLARLRESSVTTVAESSYSQLIGKFINDTKRQVEDSYNWNCLYTTITVSTVGGTSNYTVAGSKRRQKSISVIDSTNDTTLRNVPAQWILEQQQSTTTENGQPIYYAWNGWDGVDSKVEFWPTPDGVYVIKMNLIVPQADLSGDTDVLLVPEEPVILGAYARAIVERGEDGGLASGEAYNLFKASLADWIALEATRQVENDVWVAS